MANVGDASVADMADMAEVISPATAMSASQRAKKVSMTEDEPALVSWITEVVETLSRPAGNVRVAKHHLTKVKDQLSDFRENGDEVDLEQLEGLPEILAKDAAMCRRLKPDAFALLVEVLLETKESKVRERGFYILAKSLHEEGFVARDSFAGRLHEIGRGCLIQLYERFVEKTVAYGSRRWMGSLLMELIGDSEENQQDVAMMSTSKRAKLGHAVLYESSEIIRAMSGRLLAVMLGADHEARSFFPPGSSEKLFADYPGSTQSDSQWDKAFQAYVDEIWPAIEAYNDSGELQFAQHVATVPSHPGIESGALARNRSIYIEISDSVRVYVHFGNDHFDSAVDVPLTSIEGIETTLTLIDQSQSKEYVDVVLRIKPSTHCFINSTQASLSMVRLTVDSQKMADGVRDGIVRSLATITEVNNAKSQISATSPARVNMQESSQSKKSYGDEDLVLNGSYEQTVVNDSFVAAAATMIVSGVAIVGEDPFMASVHESRSIVEEVEQLLPGHVTASDVTGNYDEESAPEEQTSLSRTAVELDVFQDVNTGEVLSSKVLGMVVVPKVRRRPKIKATRPVTEVTIERSANGHQGNPSSSEAVGSEVVENVVPSRLQKQAVKPKASANDNVDLTSSTPPPKKQILKPRAPIKDSRGQLSDPQAAESVVVEKVTAPANLQSLKSKAAADNKVHASVAQEEQPTAVVDSGAPLPEKKDLKSKALKKASQAQQSSHHEEKPLEFEKVVVPPAKKQALKSKTRTGVAKKKDEAPVELKQVTNKPPKTLGLEPELQASSSIEEEGPQKLKLVAPSKRNIKTVAKVSTQGNVTNQPVVNDMDDEDIYDFIPSPPKAARNVKAVVQGKKAAATTTSFKGHSKKSKANDQPLMDEVEEVVTTTKSSKVKKEPANKKPLKQPLVPPLAAAAAPKRKTAPRSTKGKKSMKDLSDSEIENDDLLVVAEPKEKRSSTSVANKRKAAAVPESEHEASESNVVTKLVPIQKAKQNTTTARDLRQEAVEVQPADTIHAHSEATQEVISKPKVAKAAIIGQLMVNRDVNFADTQDTRQWSPVDHPGWSPASQIDDENPFDDPVNIASIEQSDGLDMPLSSTAEAQTPIGTPIEAKFGRKMAEIFGFTSANAQRNVQQMEQVSEPPKDAELIRSPHTAAILELTQHADEFDKSKSAPPSKDGHEAIMEDDGFFVLSSPPNVKEDVATAALHINKEHSSADDPIVLSDPEEDDEDDEDDEKSLAQVAVRKAVEKRTVLTSVVERPAKRQRIAKEAALSSPPQPQVVSSSERATRKVKAQAPRLAVRLPGSSPYVAAASEAASSIDQSALLDDHQARKAPLISFGPLGPRNQGLTSTVKAARVSNEQKPNTLSAILDDISKKSVEKRPSPAQQALNAAIESNTRTPRVPSFEDSLARHDTIAMGIQPDEDDGLTFFDAGQSIASSRSHSRVDVNGSPKARRAPLAQLGGHRRESQTDLKSKIGSTTRPQPQRYIAPAEKASSRATFEDDTTLFGSGLFISSNRKARPAAPDDDLDFESRYTPHHAAKNGDYVGVADLKVVDAAPEMADPFSKKAKRQDSEFAQRLRLSQTLNMERDGKPKERPTAKAQARFQPPAKPVPIQSHLSSIADDDATLVDIENRRPQHRRWRYYHASSSDSSDSEAESYEERYESPPPDPQQIWKEALKPHQKDVSDVLHHVVDGLLQQLFDREPAVHAIADEYRTNGAKIVEALKSKIDAEIQSLHHHATSTIEDLTAALRRSRAALKSAPGTGKALDDQYRQWRARQHALQLLPFMAREVGGRR